MLRPYSSRGFTLVEMMVLIGILGLVLAIAVPSFRGYNRANRLAATADMIASDMALARAMAVSQGRIIRFGGTAAGYTINDPATNDILRSRTFEGTVRLPGAVTINFFPWGAADTAILTLDDGAAQKDVRILPTGIVEVGP